MDQEFLLEISHLGIVDLFLFQMMCFAPAVTISSNHNNMVKVLTDFSVENSGTESKHSRLHERLAFPYHVQC